MFFQNFQIPCVFPDRELFLVIFPVFPGRGYPGNYIMMRGLVTVGYVAVHNVSMLDVMKQIYLYVYLS